MQIPRSSTFRKLYVSSKNTIYFCCRLETDWSSKKNRIKIYRSVFEKLCYWKRPPWTWPRDLASLCWYLRCTTFLLIMHKKKQLIWVKRGGSWGERATNTHLIWVAVETYVSRAPCEKNGLQVSDGHILRLVDKNSLSIASKKHSTQVPLTLRDHHGHFRMMCSQRFDPMDVGPICAPQRVSYGGSGAHMSL